LNERENELVKNEARKGHELNNWLHINRILLADDQAVNLEVLSNYLRTLQVYDRCDFCCNGLELIEKIK